MTARQVRLLSGGAAHGLVEALATRFRDETGAEIAGSFGPVGGMRDRLLEGEPADLVILTQALISELEAKGRVRRDTRVELGRVRTGIAVKQGDPAPDVSSAQALRAALLQAKEIFFSDPVRATAGAHFAKVIDSLGLREALAPRLRSHPGGTAAMRAMSKAGAGGVLGCTQITEIMMTPGVSLAGPLPAEFDLTTVYAAAVCAGSACAELAGRLAGLLGGELTHSLRTQLGFEAM